MKLFRFLSLPLLVMLIALLCISAVAQDGEGRISGQVADPQGGAIPGASVQVINQETLVKRQVQTNEVGAYDVPGLPSGRYQVIVEASGFTRRSSEILTLSAGRSLVFNAQITVTKVTEEVQVSGGAPTTVELDSASISTTLGSQEIAGYQLNGRNFSQLITLSPGVSNQTGQDEAKVGVAGSAKFSVNGGRVEYNTFEVDGSDVLNTSINASRGQGEPLMVYPSIDAIQDMKVLTADYSALYGKSASGSVLISTKSGTDKFHGDLYGFVRNEIFNARNYFDQPDAEAPGYQGRPKYRTPLYRRLDLGGTVGGPLVIPHLYDRAKPKTFFFFSEEVRREKTPVDYNQAVPTMAERAGDFSDLCPTRVPNGPATFDPTQQYPDCPEGQASDNPGSYNIGRTVPVDYISAALLNSGLIPEPNATSGCNSTNPSPLAHCYVGSISPATHWREELFRIDHDLTEHQRLSFRYVHDAWDTVTLVPQWGVVHNSFPTVQNQLTGPGLDMALILAQTLPHGFINLFSAGYVVQHITLAPEPGPGVTSLNRPQVLDDPALTGGTAVQGAPDCSVFAAPGNSFPPNVTECPMGYIFSNGYGGNKLPGLVFQGNNGAYGGHGFAADTGYAPWNQSNPTFTLRDDASKTIGKHTLQWGFWGAYTQQNALSGVTGANSGDAQGLLTFSNQQSIHTSGNAFADFLAGSGFVNNDLGTTELAYGGIKSYTQDSGQAKYYNRNRAADLYLQDDWRVTPHLTINVGLRASLFGAWYNPNNTAYNWRPEAFNASLGASIYIDPNNGYLVNKIGGSPIPLNRTGPYSLSSLDPTITNGLVQCGVHGVSDSCMSNDLFHPSPRVGFSWDPWGDGKTAIRAGYGLFWEHGTSYEANVASLTGSAPLILSETQSNLAPRPIPSSNPYNAYNLIGLSCQDGSAQCGGVTPPVGGATFPLNVTTIPKKAVYSSVQQWSLSMQRELHRGLVGQLAYVGTKGTHLTAVRDLNQLQPLSDGLNPFAAGEPITASVCASGANPPHYFSVLGLNSSSNGAPITIPSSPAIGPGDPGYTNIFVACTGNPGFAQTFGVQTPIKLGVSADTQRPYPGFSNIISVENVADSEYDALQASLRQTTGSLTIGLAYTYSHSLDDASDRATANFANSLDIHSSHASSDFDQKHIFNLSYIYDLP
ncbi:MAG TPA: TonB-dependent receptor, partial [Acidobacteriaceae bacterium]